MKRISNVLLIVIVTLFLANFNSYAATSNDLLFNFDEFDLDRTNAAWYWQSLTLNYDSDGDGTKDSWSLTAPDPYNFALNRTTSLSATNLSDYDTELSDGTFRIKGDTMIAHNWSRPFENLEHIKVDVKFNYASRADGEQEPLLKLFGYSVQKGGTEEQIRHNDQAQFEDSGLVILDGGMYSINPDTNRASDYALSIEYVRNEDIAYGSLRSGGYYTKELLAPDTLANDTWYTIERIVDMRNNVSKLTNTYVYQNQKVIVTNKNTGEILLDSGWTRVGYNNHKSRTLAHSLLAYTAGFNDSDSVEFDNYSCTKLTDYDAMEYVFEEGTEDYFQTGLLHGLTPDPVTFMTGARLCDVDSDNVILKADNTVLDKSYYAVEMTDDGMGFKVSFNKELEELRSYTLTVTGYEYETFNIPGKDMNYTFMPVLFSVENAGFVNESGTPLDNEALNIGDTVKYNVTITNVKDEEIDYMIVVALYSTDNRLLDITGEWGKLGSEPLPVSTDAITVTENGCRAEVFIFDNMMNMELKKY